MRKGIDSTFLHYGVRNEDMAFSNTCGSIGAYIAYFFITCCFGFPAFLIPLFLIFTSLRLMGAYKVSLVKWFFGSMLAMIWKKALKKL